MTVSTNKLILLFATLALLGCWAMDVLLITLNGDHAEPVTIWLQGPASQALQRVNVYRVSVSKKLELLTERTQLSPDILRVEGAVTTSYYRSVRLELPAHQWSSLRAVTVAIGPDTVRYSATSLRNEWRLVDSTASTMLVEAPLTMRRPPSRLPMLKAVINWKGDGQLIRSILVDNWHVELLLLLALISNGLGITGWSARWADWVRKDSSRPRWIVGGLVIGLIILRFPLRLSPITTGLDPSWMLGLSWVYIKGLMWGQEVVFTYGPLYWLLYPSSLLPASTLVIAIGLTLLLLGYSLQVLITLLIDAIRNDQLSVRTGLVILLLLSTLDYMLLDVVAVAALSVFARPIRGRFNIQVIPVVLILALLSLVKLSNLALSLTLLTLYTGINVWNRRVSPVLIVWVVFGLATLLIWRLSGQPLTNYGPFLTRSYQLAQGYSEAMSTPTWNESASLLSNIVNISFLVIALLASLGVFLLVFTSPVRSRLWRSVLLSLPVLFLAFKEGYIRFDFPHFVLFFSQWLLVLLTYRLALAQDNQATWLGGHWPWYGSLLLCVVILPVHLPTFDADLLGAFRQETREQTLRQATQQIRSKYVYGPETRQVFRSGTTVDVLPYDIAQLYAYGANWKPRPIMQSYAAYTGSLDSLNAKALAGTQAPYYVQYAFKSIDNRYPFFDEPAVTQALLTHYEVAANDANAHLLLRRKAAAGRLQAISIGHGYIGLGQAVTIPTRPNRFTYLKAQIDLSIWGKLLNFLYKIPPLSIEIHVRDLPNPVRYKLIRQTATDGLLVSHYVDDISDVEALWSGQVPPNVKAIRIVGNSFVYKKEIKVEFTNASTN